ncbi:hypothetical protein ACFTWF_24170 [Rhodococcus sp. NPDC056960]|uniref:hypothetical protein n=1 Tax=Rhodococcus sp. NPDC056960 TaxID=3345982 RepID=UPI00363FB89A
MTTTWTLWTGALLVVIGSAALLQRRVLIARVLWLLAALAFVAAGIGALAAAVLSLPLVLALVVAIAVTLVLVKATIPSRQNTMR